MKTKYFVIASYVLFFGLGYWAVGEMESLREAFEIQRKTIEVQRKEIIQRGEEIVYWVDRCHFPDKEVCTLK